MAKDKGRYEVKEVTGTGTKIFDTILGVATGGFYKPSTDIQITDTKTGKTSTGTGESITQAKNDAHSKFDKK